MKDSKNIGGDEEFDQRNKQFINLMYQDISFRKKSKQWFEKAFSYEYLYHFKWLGRAIIQFPQDIVVLQEIIWKTKPKMIIETGIARGGLLNFLCIHVTIIR